MTTVPLAKDHTNNIDDAHYLNLAVAAYTQYFSGMFTGTWPEAFARYRSDQTTINLVAGEIDAPEGAVILVRDYDAGLDDGHYLNWAVDVVKGQLSGVFTDAWPEAWDALTNNQTPIDLVEGETVDAPPTQLPAIKLDIDRLEPPKPTQLPADQAPPKPTQY